MTLPNRCFKRLISLLGLSAMAIISNAYAFQSDDASPLSPTAPVSQVLYQSAFDGYFAFQNEALAPWRDLNELVKGGGHTGHGDQSMQGMQPEQKKTEPENIPNDPNPHQQHQMK